MRSISESACFISSIDSWYECSARRSYPQFFCIFECPKYWLTAVSSAVRTSLRSSMISGCPCIGTLTSGSRARPAARPGGGSGCRLYLLRRQEPGEENPDRRPTRPASRPCPAVSADVVDGARAAIDRVAHAAVADNLAVADDHPGTLSIRRVASLLPGTLPTCGTLTTA